MPYIDQSLRGEFASDVQRFKDKIVDIYALVYHIEKFSVDKQDGIINFILSSLLKDEKNPKQFKGIIEEFLLVFYKPKYFNYNRLIGLLRCMACEFIRRGWSLESIEVLLDLIANIYLNEISPYEDKKIKENGDLA